ncbi:hypothetical protein IU433_19055 [Nocardia puris]|uniref:hypothetical protein n=1 Tax=Nocardia puris TaxID=208602 RepID=UPI001893C103|nr:hypothetical protein [Nocardia puris]MBF6211542.1 hypothetical protein [Nocardia puris]MBF6366794.1 hypothetical protein [Nocardia puris]MBF6461135.1 hypothetical protein [Nocardia puris]
MLYTESTRAALIAEMDGYISDLGTYKAALLTASAKLVRHGWEENEAAGIFQERMDLLTNAQETGELDDTHVKIGKLRDAINAAFDNAKAADRRVYNAF